MVHGSTDENHEWLLLGILSAILSTMLNTLIIICDCYVWSSCGILVQSSNLIRYATIIVSNLCLPLLFMIYKSCVWVTLFHLFLQNPNVNDSEFYSVFKRRLSGHMTLDFFLPNNEKSCFLAPTSFDK